MKNKHINQSIIFSSMPTILNTASVVGKKEGEGPLGDFFDMVLEDEYLGEESWEKAESKLQEKTVEILFKKSKLKKEEIDFILSGDLQNQCAASHYSMRKLDAPFLGLYGACSTMAEALILSAMLIDGGFCKNILFGTSSHFCSAEKQFRFPLEYGGIRTPTSQWTVTGAGFGILSSQGGKIKITSATVGRIVDKNVTDINNMGAAMAPAAADTLISHFKDLDKKPSDYDLILTGDLGIVGSDLLCDIMQSEGYDIYSVHNDCGKMIYDAKNQGVASGGSGCGCSASVLCSHIFNELSSGNLKKIAFMATGALMNPQTVLQGESIPSIAHLVTIEA